MSLLLPVLPIRDMVLFPGVIVPLFVGRPRSLKAIEEATLQQIPLKDAAFTVALRRLTGEGVDA